MTGFSESGTNFAGVTYELLLSAAEVRRGSTRVLWRNGKPFQLTIPVGISSDNVITIENGLQTTDNRPGDITISIKIKPDQTGLENETVAGIVEITDSSFEDEVLRSQLPVVVDFWASWCGACLTMSPLMEDIADCYKGKFKFCMMDVDENPAAADRFQVNVIPMILIFRKGRVVGNLVGPVPEFQVRAKLDSLANQ